MVLAAAALPACSGAIKGSDRRQVTCKALDLDCRELPGATLSKRGGPDVAGEHVRVAMYAERHLLLRINGIVPGTGGKLNDPAPYTIRNTDACQAGATHVEDANNVSVCDVARRRVVRVHARNLAPAMLGLGAMPSEIQLTVKARGRLISDEHKRRIR
jgi:hypothetical protein